MLRQQGGGRLRSGSRADRASLERLEERRLLAIGPGGHDYRLLAEPPGLTWQAAQQAAAAIAPPDGFGPGHLATLGSSAEQAFLKDTFGEALGTDAAWLGFTDAALAGQWSWIDDTVGLWQDPRYFPAPLQTAFVNWQPGQPAVAQVELLSARRSVWVNTGFGEPYEQFSTEFDHYLGDLEVFNPLGPGGHAVQDSWVNQAGQPFFGSANLEASARAGARSTYEVSFALVDQQPVRLKALLTGFVASDPFETRGTASFEIRLSRTDVPGGPQHVFDYDRQVTALGTDQFSLDIQLNLQSGQYTLSLYGAAEGAPVSGGRSASAGWRFSLAVGKPQAAVLAGAGGDWLSRAVDQPAPYYLVEFEPSGGPEDLGLAPASVAERSPTGVVVGALTATGGTGPMRYELLDSASGRFALLGDELFVADGSLLDFETQPAHTIRVRVMDALGRTFEKDLAVAVTDVNEPPTEIFFDGAVVAESTPPGAVVATLFAIDPDDGDLPSLALVDSADGRFALSGNELRVAGALDFETAPQPTVRVRARDKGGFEIERDFAIAVANINEPPLLSLPAKLEFAPGVELPLAGWELGDPDLIGADVDLKPLRLSLLADHGALWFGQLIGLEIVAGENGGGAIAVEGPLSLLRPALDTLVYRSNPGPLEDALLTVKLNDLGHSGAGAAQSATATLRLRAVSPLATVEDRYEIGAGQTLFVQTYSAAVVGSQPWAWWRLDEEAGAATAQDSAGGHAGAAGATTFGGPGALEKEPDKAARIGAAEARIVIAEPGDLAALAAGFSLEAWIKPGEAALAQQIVSTRQGATAGWSLGLSEQRLVFSAAGVQEYVAAGRAVPIGAWSHVVVVVHFDHSVSYYLDGELVDRVAGVGLAPAASQQMALGGHPSDDDPQSWTGDLDEIAVYGRPLSAAEVARHYQASRVDRTVLANDGDGQARLSAELVVGPTRGTVEFLPDGSFVYRPELGFVGVDQFQYVASDGQFTSRPTKVTIELIGQPGDTDGDGDVDLTDFARLKQHFGGPGDRSDGDFTGDGLVDLDDFAILKQHFGTRPPL